jgi:tripartite ATP-independent transporter DctM subunit
MIAITASLFLVLLFLGAPVSYSMGLASVAAIASQGSIPMAIVIQRMMAGVDGFVFVAVPFYILAGALMDTGGITIRLVRLAQALLGHIRGGLGMVVVVAEYLFSGISGSVVADTSAVGGVVIPLMRKAGYSGPHSVAIVSAASAMGILVPPCIPMIVMAGMVNLSVAGLFAAGFIPGAVMAILLMGFIYLQARRQGLSAGQRATWRQVRTAFLEAIIPLGMPVVIFGGILAGIMTATEAGAVAVAYGAIAGIVIYKEIPLRQVPHILCEVAITNGIVMLLASTAMVLAYILAVQRVPGAIAMYLKLWVSAPFVFLLFTILVFMIFGGLLEGLPAIVIFVPILQPVANAFGINPFHFGIVAIAALGVGLFLPPTGLGLFVACGIAKVPMESVIRPFVPYITTLIIGVLVVAAVPWLTLVLPRLLNLGQ